MFVHRLLCLSNGAMIEDDGLVLSAPGVADDSLLRSVYPDRSFRPDPSREGIYRYGSWLPVSRELAASAAPITFKSEHLAARLGLERLYITFSGRWEERGANMGTGSFKECEAWSVLARFPADSGLAMVVASAGNTARAFVRAASMSGIRVVVVVPKSRLSQIWVEGEKGPSVFLVAAVGGDYLDAIRLSEKIAALPGFVREGGARNVARRDGLGVCVLSAAEVAGEIPDYYFQAVGSGTGAIAAYEANLRLNESGDFEPKKMRLMLSQNAPFIPIVEAWRARRRSFPQVSEPEARASIVEIDAKTLSNRNPPWAMAGGLHDVLAASGGDVMAVTNPEARQARRLFRRLEGCDISPEAGVATASLVRQARTGGIPKGALVMLNVTGGGHSSARRDSTVRRVRPDFEAGIDDFDSDGFLEAYRRFRD